MVPDTLVQRAEALLEVLRRRRSMLATAESCTGGLIAAVLTEVPGSSDVVDRGFVTYSNAAKTELLGVPAATVSRHGAVSEETARAMVEGALAHSRADVAVAVTGVAGPGGGSAEKPVGLVYVAAAMRGGSGIRVLCRRCLFGDIGRRAVRLATVEAAFDLIEEVAGIAPPATGSASGDQA